MQVAALAGVTLPMRLIVQQAVVTEAAPPLLRPLIAATPGLPGGVGPAAAARGLRPGLTATMGQRSSMQLLLSFKKPPS